MEKKATIKDVSRYAGVSTATVSRTLNNPEVVSPKTRARVMKAVNDLNFCYNALAAGLKSGNSYVIGYVIPNMRVEYYNKIFDSINDELEPRGYNILVATHNNNPEQEKIAIKRLLEFNVDAIVVATAMSDAKIYEDIDRDFCPVILIDRKLGNANLSAVSENCEEVSYELMNHVINA